MITLPVKINNHNLLITLYLASVYVDYVDPLFIHLKLDTEFTLQWDDYTKFIAVKLLGFGIGIHYYF